MTTHNLILTLDNYTFNSFADECTFVEWGRIIKCLKENYDDKGVLYFENDKAATEGDLRELWALHARYQLEPDALRLFSGKKKVGNFNPKKPIGQFHSVYPASNPVATQGDSFLLATHVNFYSPHDKISFFTWLGTISSIIKIEGNLTNLYLHLKENTVSAEEFKEIKSLFLRYHIDKEQLNKLHTKEEVVSP